MLVNNKWVQNQWMQMHAMIEEHEIWTQQTWIEFARGEHWWA